MKKVGIGFRRELESGLFALQSSFECVEIIAESYFNPTRSKLNELMRLKEAFVIVPHGLRLSIGAVERPRQSYMDELARLLDRVDAAYHGDHFALTSTERVDLGHLSPLWYTETALDTVISNVREVQRFFGRQLVLEIITHPFEIPGATMAPAEFITRTCRETNCGILLDLTNVYINAKNAGEDPREFIRALPLQSVRQLHLVGYECDGEGIYVDSHDKAIQDDLWTLYDYAVTLCSPEFVIIERDDNFPDVTELAAEAGRARALWREV